MKAVLSIAGAVFLLISIWLNQLGHSSSRLRMFHTAATQHSTAAIFAGSAAFFFFLALIWRFLE